MKNFFKGFLVGIGKIIPGVSGAVIAMSMGIYDKSIEYICNFKNNKKESIKYLLPIGIGLILSVIFFSKIISFALNRFYLITMLFFIGLIIGGVPLIINKVQKKNYYITIISFVILFVISISSIDNIYVVKNNLIDMFVFFVSGVVEAIGTVVPGISSTALLMVMGTYNIVITSIGNLNNIKVLLPFSVGLFIGLIVVVKIISYLFKRCEKGVYAFVLGVLLSSIVLLILQSFKFGFTFLELIIGLVVMVLGIFISRFLKEK